MDLKLLEENKGRKHPIHFNNLFKYTLLIWRTLRKYKDRSEII